MLMRTLLLGSSLLFIAACQAASGDLTAEASTQPAVTPAAVEIAARQPTDVKAPSPETTESTSASSEAKLNAPEMVKEALAAPIVSQAAAARPAPVRPAAVQSTAAAPVTVQQPVPVKVAAVQPAIVRAPDARQAAPQPAAAPQPVLIAQASSTPDTAPAASGPNAAYNAFLSKYVVNRGGINLVRYGDVSPSDRASLQGYIEGLSRSGPPSGSDDAIMAYWFNLYNAKTVELILENYPLKSIRDISGPWKKKRLTVAGKPMSLNDIEHKTVRAQYDEPRVHYAFNCASIGCPNLKTTAWEAETLDADLTQAARDFIGHSRGVSVDERGRVDASKIFKWYKEDFGGNEQSLLNHFEKYASGATLTAIRANSKIDDFDYDWSLNIAK